MSLPFRRVSASRALHWWAEGWRGFRRAPMAWVGLSVALLVALALLGMLPFGRLLAQWLSVPLFALGAVYAALLQRRARDVQRVLPEVLVEEARTDGVFDDSARLWRRRIGPLLLASLFVLLLGGAFSVAFVVLSAAALGVGLAGFGALGALGGGVGLLAGAGAMAGGVAALMLLGMIALFVVNIAFWFVGTLVVLGGLKPWDAVLLSLRASLANVGALALFSLLLLPVAVVALLPMGLGLLVLLPVLSASSYASFDDVFGQPR